MTGSAASAPAGAAAGWAGTGAGTAAAATSAGARAPSSTREGEQAASARPAARSEVVNLPDMCGLTGAEDWRSRTRGTYARSRRRSKRRRAERSDVAAGEAALLEIALMVLLGAPERLCGDDLGDDGPRPAAAGVPSRPGPLRGGALRVVVHEDRRAVLRAHVGALAVERGRVVARKEDVEQPVVAHPRGIERHLHHFRMAGLVAADIFVRRVVGPSATVADGGAGDPFRLAEGGLHAPEAAGPEGRGVRFHHGLLIRSGSARAARGCGAARVRR